MTRIVALLLALSGAALAQVQPSPNQDPAFLNKALDALQRQRNMALDSAAVAEARAALLAEEVEKLRAQIAKSRTDAPKE